jgi:hypothetical protein
MDGACNFHAQYCNIIIIHTPAGQCSELVTKKNPPKVRNAGGALLEKNPSSLGDSRLLSLPQEFGFICIMQFIAYLLLLILEGCVHEL